MFITAVKKQPTSMEPDPPKPSVFESQDLIAGLAKSDPLSIALCITNNGDHYQPQPKQIEENEKLNTDEETQSSNEHEHDDQTMEKPLSCKDEPNVQKTDNNRCSNNFNRISSFTKTRIHENGVDDDDSEDHDAHLEKTNFENHSYGKCRSCVHNVRNSKFRFILDYKFILLNIFFCTTVSSLISFVVLNIDIGKTKGFDESTRIFLFFLYTLTSTIARLLVCPLSFIPHIKSITIMGVSGLMVGVSLIGLGNSSNYASFVVTMVFQGLGSGGIYGIYPKTVLDVGSIDMLNYPLALGMSGTTEGVSDLVLPIFIGKLLLIVLIYVYVLITGRLRTLLTIVINTPLYLKYYPKC